ncbi:hypothetical protein FACS1894186_5800 [Alphaproteobacteria bacterium]|nr:hypothetical protein FACS1894186_5800 [Alphaproteobacteria bacterium]
MEMNNLTTTTKLVKLDHGKIFTDSQIIAKEFEKEHSKVMRSIDGLRKALPPDRVAIFGDTVETRENPSGGAPIASKFYTMNRDGWMLLTMGFTGEKALLKKLDFIDAFNAMEAVLLSGGLVQVAGHTRRKALPASSKPKTVVLAPAEHAAIGGIIKSVLPGVLSKFFGDSFQMTITDNQPAPAQQQLPLDSLDAKATMDASFKTSQAVGDAITAYGLAQYRQGKTHGLLEGASNPTMVELMKQAKKIQK